MPEKQQRQQKNVPMGSMDRERLASNQRNKQNAQPDPPSGAAILVAPELPFRPSTDATAAAGATGQATAADPANGDSKPLTNGQANGVTTNGATTNGTTPAAAPGLPGTKQKFVAQPISGVTPLALTEENAPDLHLLTPEEVELCKVSRLQPKPYLMIKEQVLKEALKGNGTLKKKQVKEISRLDSQKGGRLFDFFVNSGWIGKV